MNLDGLPSIFEMTAAEAASNLLALHVMPYLADVALTYAMNSSCAAWVALEDD